MAQGASPSGSAYPEIRGLGACVSFMLFRVAAGPHSPSRHPGQVSLFLGFLPPRQCSAWSSSWACPAAIARDRPGGGCAVWAEI